MSGPAPVLQLHADDNVAVVLRGLGGVPQGHKVALADIPAGGEVRKYGAVIGRATAPIRAGEHVHVHNIESTRLRGDM